MDLFSGNLVNILEEDAIRDLENPKPSLKEMTKKYFGDANALSSMVGEDKTLGNYLEKSVEFQSYLLQEFKKNR